MRTALIAPAVVAISALALTACGSSSPTYYVGADRTAVARIEWSPPQHGHAIGTITDDTLTGDAPSGSVDVQTVAVTVTFHGATVTFAGAGLYALAGESLTGELNDGMLRITAPDASGYLESAVLRPATPAAYDSDLANLRRQVRRDDRIAALRQARRKTAAQLATDQQQVSSDESNLAAAASQISGDLAQLGTDLQQATTDMQTLSTDAASGCSNASTVTSDDYTVNNDGSAVGNDAMTLTNDISTTQSDVSQLQSDGQALQKAGGVLRGDPNVAISQAQSAISRAVSQADADIDTMNQYMQQAYKTASSLAGSACAGAS